MIRVPVKVSPTIRAFSIFLLLFASTQWAKGQDYNLLGPVWPAGSKVVMQLELGSSPVALQDGSASWNASAADALDIWNGYLDFISISSVSSATVPQASGDGVNSVFFSDSVFGESFGDLTLAVTVYLTDDSTQIETEADVVVNRAYHFDSYRGVLQSGADDIHRILLHEFGHVLGLAHSGTAGGIVLMEPVISDLDHPAADDIAGIRTLYGASFYYAQGANTLRIGYYYIQDLYSNNNPTSFTATGLPPGIEIDPITGRLIGRPITSGSYTGVITAHGPIVNVSEGFQFDILGLEEVPGLLSILPLNASSLVADPTRPRVYFSGYDGIGMIDSETLEATILLSGVPSCSLSLSADNSTLLYTENYGNILQEFRFDLNAMSAQPALAIPGNGSAVLEGLNNQAYVAGLGVIYQFDATTGELQQTFAPKTAGAYDNAKIAIAPDRQTLYVARQGTDGEVSSWDISTPVPTLVEHLSGDCYSATPSRDGQSLYYDLHGPGGATAFRAHLPTLSPATSFATSFYLGGTFEGVNGVIYQSIFPTDSSFDTPSGSYSVYDPVTLKQISEIPLGNLELYYPYTPLDVVFDNTGKYLFAIVNAVYFGQEVWVLSTDFASFPPPVHPTKNLRNISTRARVEPGEDAMIGGFIVQGPDPKRVLVRGLGPSLPMTGALSNPVLDLYDSSGELLASNDNWVSDETNILTSLIPPSSKRESAISMTLQPGAYTAVVRDLNSQSGVALVEMYDLDPKASLLANISTRGKVETGDNVMIGGFIIGGDEPTKVLVRGIGPSLASKGILLPLSDPVLELHDGTGKLLSTNDNWRSTQQNDIIATSIAPTDDRESAILATLQPGNYTAVVRGQSYTTGVALVEVYNLDSASAKSN